MPRKQVGFQNPKYETYRFIFNYIWEDNEELITVEQIKAVIKTIEKLLETLKILTNSKELCQNL